MQRGESVGACSRVLVEHGACALEYNQTQSLAVQERPRSVLLGAFVARSQSLHFVVDEHHLAAGIGKPIVDQTELFLEESVVVHHRHSGGCYLIMSRIIVMVASRPQLIYIHLLKVTHVAVVTRMSAVHKVLPWHGALSTFVQQSIALTPAELTRQWLSEQRCQTVRRLS